MKVDKNTANHMLVIKNTTNNTVYTMQELHAFLKHLMKLHPIDLYLKFHFHKYFRYILQLIYQLSFFYTYNFYDLNILQYHIIYHIHTHNY